MCVTWDFTDEGRLFNEGFYQVNDHLCDIILKGWSTDGCTVSQVKQNGTVTCSCDHLSNFAVLVVSFQ